MKIKLSKLKLAIDEITDVALQDATLRLAKFKGYVNNICDSGIIDSFGVDRVNHVANYYGGLISTADTDMAHGVAGLCKNRIGAILRAAKGCSTGMHIESETLEDIFANELHSAENRLGNFGAHMFSRWLRKLTVDVGLDTKVVEAKSAQIKDIDKISKDELKTLLLPIFSKDSTGAQAKKLTSEFLQLLKADGPYKTGEIYMASYDFFDDSSKEKSISRIQSVFDVVGKVIQQRYKIFSYINSEVAL